MGTVMDTDMVMGMDMDTDMDMDMDMDTGKTRPRRDTADNHHLTNYQKNISSEYNPNCDTRSTDY